MNALNNLTARAQNVAVGVLAGGVVLVDSVSRFWSMAGDLLLVGALILAMKVPTKK